MHIVEVLSAFIIGLYLGGYPMFKAWKRHHEREIEELKKYHDEELDVAEQSGWYNALEDDKAVRKAYRELIDKDYEY